MNSTNRLIAFALLLAFGALLQGCGAGSASKADGESKPGQTETAPARVRLGYFANITHAQALIGVSRGDFKNALGGAEVETKIFNAGPAVVEAVFAGELDIAYIGPSPAVNAYVKSHGKAVRIVSGSAANGVTIVARKESGIAKLEDLKGRRVATPQFGNTQDVSARVYLTKTLGAALKEKGGETEIVTVANAEQLGLFKAGQLDAAWVPEPWGARLVHETGAAVIAEEKDLWPGKRFCTAVVIVSETFLAQHPKTVEAFLRAHAAVTRWMNEHPGEAAALVNAELKTLTGKALPEKVLRDAFGRIEFTTDPLESSVAKFAEEARDLGMLKDLPDLKGLFALELLQRVKSEGMIP
ncbi:MAG: aliphatic sulfonate ABC transporter substrate-binding protein [Planctomycetes bacterium]|nr:aliphatic sulfonate ABC transporter substrate-binding protein [Planctomycetota bacterium]